MIVEQGRGRTVYLRYRDESDKRIQERITDVLPYCFIRTDDHMEMNFGAMTHSDSNDGYVGVYGEELTKLIFNAPGELRDFLKDTGYQTWEGNIPFVNRVLADQNEPIPQYNYRKAYLDLEWKTESGEITIIGLKDSYTGRLFYWAQKPDEIEPGRHTTLPCKDHPEGKKEVLFDPPLMAFKDEKSLLEHFTSHIKKMDPDILIGWYLQGADIQQLSKRMRACQLNPSNLSPFNRHRFEYSDWDQPIPGRLCFDLMVGFEKLWVLKHGQLASKKLDDVAWAALKERKLELKDGHDTFYTDVATYIDYNGMDVLLTERLDELLNVSEHFISLAHAAQVQFRDTHKVTKLATGLFLRDEEFTERIPTRPQFDKVDYQGADIQDADPGIYPNIGILDIKAMYHSNAAKSNISWDTLDDEGVDCGNGTKFSLDQKGLLVRSMDRLTQLRNEYKRKMKTKGQSPHIVAKWDAMQHAMKSLVASLYGICGDAKYGLYHPKVAAAITFTSRETLGQLRDYAEEAGHTCRYGHTDSIFIDVASAEEGEALNRHLNTLMAPIEVEFEKWCDSFLIIAKNRYACKVSWTDGEHHDPKTYVKGIELIQARMPNAMKKAMQTTLDHILSGATASLVDDELCSLIDTAIKGQLEASELFMKGKLTRNLDKYSVLSGASAGAAWANKHLGKGYKSGDYFLVAINNEGQYIAFDDPNEIEGITKVGYRIMVERFIVNKVKPLYTVAGWSMQNLHNAMNGVSKTEWL
jgi:DNA polymerase elongation subunit (family B)